MPHPKRSRSRSIRQVSWYRTLREPIPPAAHIAAICSLVLEVRAWMTSPATIQAAAAATIAATKIAARAPAGVTPERRRAPEILGIPLTRATTARAASRRVQARDPLSGIVMPSSAAATSPPNAGPWKNPSPRVPAAYLRVRPMQAAVIRITNAPQWLSYTKEAKKLSWGDLTDPK